MSLCVNVCVKTVMLVCRMLSSGRPQSVVAYLGAVGAQRASVGWPNPHPAHLCCCCAVGNRNKPSGTATVDPVQLAAFHSRPHSLSIGTGLVPHSLWTGAALLTGLAAQPLSTQSSWRRPPMRLKPRQRLGRRRRRAAFALWTCPARRVSTQYNCCLVGSPTAAAGVGLAAGAWGVRTCSRSSACPTHRSQAAAWQTCNHCTASGRQGADQTHLSCRAGRSLLDIRELTLRVPSSGATLVQDLTLSVTPGERSGI